MGLFATVITLRGWSQGTEHHLPFFRGGKTTRAETLRPCLQRCLCFCLHVWTCLFYIIMSKTHVFNDIKSGCRTDVCWPISYGMPNRSSSAGSYYGFSLCSKTKKKVTFGADCFSDSYRSENAKGFPSYAHINSPLRSLLLVFCTYFWPK